jgi:hypothetical protein
MAKTDLLKEAIADAKAVRETALANAKIALEEAFTPRIQSMLSAKLSEDEEMDEMAEDPTETNGNGMDAAAGAPVDEAEEELEETEDDMEEDMHMEPEAPVEEPAMEEPTMEAEDEMEEDLELEAILRELEDGEDKVEEGEEKEEMDEVSDSTDIGKGDNKMDQVSSSDQDDPGKGKLKEGEKEDMDEDDDVSIDEIINALKEDEDKEEMKETEDKEETNEAEHKEKDLEEAYNVIRFLKSKINEVNLLNAKLLFSNKLFRNHSMNESQKMKVIENFDRAQSLREVKLVFATLSESFKFSGKTKRSIKESYASKSSRSTAPKKKVISEGNQLAARWKKLANL